MPLAELTISPINVTTYCPVCGWRSNPGLTFEQGMHKGNYLCEGCYTFVDVDLTVLARMQPLTIPHLPDATGWTFSVGSTGNSYWIASKALCTTKVAYHASIWAAGNATPHQDRQIHARIKRQGQSPIVFTGTFRRCVDWILEEERKIIELEK